MFIFIIIIIIIVVVIIIIIVIAIIIIIIIIYYHCYIFYFSVLGLLLGYRRHHFSDTANFWPNNHVEEDFKILEW